MKKYIPMTHAFAKYKSMDEINAAYPGLFDGTRFYEHVKVASDGNWLLHDKHEEAQDASRRLTADEMRAMAKEEYDG